MTDRSRAELIDRYRSGMMSPAEESQFHGQLMGDDRLRKMLDAEELIGGALRSDLASVVTNHAVTEARVMASLAAASEAARRSLPTDSLPRGGGFLGSSSTLVKSMLAVVVAGGVIMGIHGIWSYESSDTSEPAVEQVQPLPLPRNVPVDTIPSQPAPAIVPTPAVGEAAQKKEPAAPSQQAEVRQLPRVIEQPRTAREEAVPESTVRSKSPNSLETTTRKTMPADIPVRKKDSVRLKIDVKNE